MRSNNVLGFLRKIIYALEKDFGFHIDLYRPTETINTKTGRRIILRNKYKIKKAIIFPNSIFRDYNYASVIKAVMPQNYDALLDTSVRRIMISKKYLPKDFNIDTNDYIVFNHDRYEIKDITEMELIDYWQLTIKQVKGEPANEVNEYFVREFVEFSESINDLRINELTAERLADYDE